MVVNWLVASLKGDELTTYPDDDDNGGDGHGGEVVVGYG